MMVMINVVVKLWEIWSVSVVGSIINVDISSMLIIGMVEVIVRFVKMVKVNDKFLIWMFLIEVVFLLKVKLYNGFCSMMKKINLMMYIVVIIYNWILLIVMMELNR